MIYCLVRVARSCGECSGGVWTPLWEGLLLLQHAAGGILWD
jgi:hypothetical protein